MGTSELLELKRELNLSLTENNHVNDGSLADKINQAIQWAWENWNIDFSSFYDGDCKPESYTTAFRQEWIENDNLEDYPI